MSFRLSRESFLPALHLIGAGAIRRQVKEKRNRGMISKAVSCGGDVLRPWVRGAGSPPHRDGLPPSDRRSGQGGRICQGTRTPGCAVREDPVEACSRPVQAGPVGGLPDRGEWGRELHVD